MLSPVHICPNLGNGPEMYKIITQGYHVCKVFIPKPTPLIITPNTSPPSAFPYATTTVALSQIPTPPPMIKPRTTLPSLAQQKTQKSPHQSLYHTLTSTLKYLSPSNTHNSFLTKKDNHQVPWNYGMEAVTTTGKKVEPEVTEIGGMTRSGRCYTPEELELIRKKSKEKMGEIPLHNDATKKALTGE